MDEMVQCHHRLSGHEFEQTPGDSGGQWGTACCSLWGPQRVRHDLTSEPDMQPLLNVFVEKVKVESVSCSVLSDSLQPHGL